jgi:hypothetical protein
LSVFTQSLDAEDLISDSESSANISIQITSAKIGGQKPTTAANRQPRLLLQLLLSQIVQRGATPRRETEEHGTSGKPDASCQPLLLVVGGHFIYLTGAASTLGKVNGLKRQVNTYFGKLRIKVFQKQNFYISSKKNPFIHDYPFILPHYAQ